LSNRVFVVHGRNYSARDAMYSFLRSLQLDPITWNDAIQLAACPAPTTLEIVKAGLDAAQCTVVLMTGDDLARLRPEYGQEPLLPQPRPNVIFEAGWALAIGGREKTILVRFGGLREFSDIDGIHMVDLDNTAAKREALADRLALAGLPVHRNGKTYLNPSETGDFEQMQELEPNANDVLQRGEFTEVIVDSSLSYSISSLHLEKEIIGYLTNGRTPNLKFNYLGALGAQNWLDLTEDPSYGHADIINAVRSHAAEIAHHCSKVCDRLDMVSLGPGDGVIDVLMLSQLQNHLDIAHYYPIDLSVELLQAAVNRVVNQGAWFNKKFRIKAIHGDFNQLARYKPIFAFDPAPNLICLLGYTLGNHDESELIGKIREGMDDGDFLLLDARLQSDQYNPAVKPTKDQMSEITRSYSHGLNNRFAFGPVESVTIADFSALEFKYDMTTKYTSVPGAFNIVTYIEDLNTKFRRTRQKLNKRRIDLAVTTRYEEQQLKEWLTRKGFSIRWSKTEKRTLMLLLQKNED
jgi:uncharacterized SAM-dependent methyltransferase